MRWTGPSPFQVRIRGGGRGSSAPVTRPRRRGAPGRASRCPAPADRARPGRSGVRPRSRYGSGARGPRPHRARRSPPTPVPRCSRDLAGWDRGRDRTRSDCKRSVRPCRDDTMCGLPSSSPTASTRAPRTWPSMSEAARRRGALTGTSTTGTKGSSDCRARGCQSDTGVTPRRDRDGCC